MEEEGEVRDNQGENREEKGLECCHCWYCHAGLVVLCSYTISEEEALHDCLKCLNQSDFIFLRHSYWRINTGNRFRNTHSIMYHEITSCQNLTYTLIGPRNDTKSKVVSCDGSTRLDKSHKRIGA